MASMWPTRTRSSLIVLAAVALVATPSALAETSIDNPDASTPTTLYFHLAGLQDFPINTQPPDDRFGGAQAKGLATPSATCVDVPGTSLDAAHHTSYGYSTPGPVQYDVQENGGPRIHPERGLASDVLLDTSVGPVLYWYLETMVLAADHDANQAPVVVPNVVVQATVRTGDDVSVGNEAFDAGDVIAQGRLGPVLLVPGTTEVAYSEVDGRHVYGFAVPLEFQADLIPKEESYNVRVDVYIENPACSDPAPPEDAYVMANHVKTHTSPGHRPRLELAVFNPLSLNALHPQFIGDELVIHTASITPWGNYDVDTNGIRVAIDGPSSPGELRRVVVNPADRDGHNGHGNDILATWVWAFKDEGAAPGVYTVRVEVPNLQGTATAIGEATFEVGDGCVDDGCAPLDEKEPVPAPGVMLAALAVLAGIALRRRST